MEPPSLFLPLLTSHCLSGGKYAYQLCTYQGAASKTKLAQTGCLSGQLIKLAIVALLIRTVWKRKKATHPSSHNTKPRKCVNGNTLKGKPSDEQRYLGVFGSLFSWPSALSSVLPAFSGCGPCGHCRYPAAARATLSFSPPREPILLGVWRKVKVFLGENGSPLFAKI